MEKIFILKGLDCPNCSAKIEKEVGELAGVSSSSIISPLSKSAFIDDFQQQFINIFSR